MKKPKNFKLPRKLKKKIKNNMTVNKSPELKFVTFKNSFGHTIHIQDAELF